MFKKTFIVAVIICFAVFMLILPTSEALAGCAEAATKSAITGAVVTFGLVVLDCLLTGCTFSAVLTATGGTGTILTSSHSCVDAWLWSKPATRPAK
ncbi:MAG: hypothetical protein E6Q61_05455 [Nitrosomonas sp.]|nr:MAG: hypothetical protein E6Q61_05455 [Nitrosomonas sp.]